MAVGQWNSNKILLKELAPKGQEHVLNFCLGQPRSLAVASFEDNVFMFVGTSDGSVAYFEISVSNARTGIVLVMLSQFCGDVCQVLLYRIV